MHSGVAVTDGCVLVAHPGKPTLLYNDLDGELDRTVELEGLLEPHGFACVDEWPVRRAVRERNGPDGGTER